MLSLTHSHSLTHMQWAFTVNYFLVPKPTGGNRQGMLHNPAQRSVSDAVGDREGGGGGGQRCAVVSTGLRSEMLFLEGEEKAPGMLVWRQEKNENFTGRFDEVCEHVHDYEKRK